MPIGESGTGKEVLAQSIHQGSYRGGQPFVDVNCAALPESLLESELFGYVPGAFTGASKNGKTGLFELANGGTLFLDEITEMPMPLQGKLLRVLQEQQIRRLGDNKNIKINVRIIAATNRDVKKAMEENVFRQDLFYRMAIAIQIPPLRERKKDLDLYINYFLQPLERQYNRHFQLSKEARQIMHNYRWPGNVRELQNVLEYCCNRQNYAALPAGLCAHGDGRTPETGLALSGAAGRDPGGDHEPGRRQHPVRNAPALWHQHRGKEEHCKGPGHISEHVL